MAIACSFCYYLINFYVKYLPGNIFTNQIVNSLAEAIAHTSPLILTKLMSQKKGFATGFITCAVSSFLVMIAEFYESQSLIPVGVLGAKAGIAVAFVFLYFSQVSFFQSSYLGLMFGATNVVGRCSTILAPIVAELQDPIPMVTSMVLCLIALFCSINLK